MKLLGEFIWKFGVMHQGTDVTQLYISIPYHLSGGMEVLSQCLEIVEAWIWWNRFQQNPNKNKWFWIFGLLILGTFHLGSGWDGWDGSQSGVLLDSCLLLKEQVKAVARWTFVQFSVMHQLPLFQDWEGLAHGHSCPHDLQPGLLQCMRLPLMNIQKLPMV